MTILGQVNFIRKEKSGSGTKWNYIYVYKCSNEGCENETRISKPRKQSGLCRKCSGLKRVGAIYAPVLADNVESISHRAPNGDGRHTVYLRCKTVGCSETLKYNKKMSGFCRVCANTSRRKRPFEYLLTKLFKSAVKRGLRVSLTYDQFANICRLEECHYCGVKLVRNPHDISAGDPVLIDRKDSSGDYSVENCVPCCTLCNFTKGPYMTYEEMLIVSEFRRAKRTGTIS